MWQILRSTLICLCLLISLFIRASGNKHPSTKTINPIIILSGRITDLKTGEPLPGASIFVTDDKIGSIADEQGNYSFKNLSAGHHVIEVSHAGYNTIAIHLEINQSLVKDFTLSPVILENQGVIVTGVSGATSSRKMPVPVSILRRADLLENSSTNIIDALTRIPGVNQLSTGPAISKPVIRGLGFNRVVVINEGIRQEGQQWGEEHGIEIDELSVGKVEVIKGPASLIYGSDALAGVINFITNIPVEEGTTRGRAIVNLQSNNELLALHGSLAGNKNGYNYNFYGTVRSAADYQNRYDGKVLNSRFHEKNVGGYIGINKSWGFTHLVFSRVDLQAGIIEGDRDMPTGKFLLYPGSSMEKIASESELNSRNLFSPYQRVQHNKIVTDNSFVLRGGRLKFNLGYQQNIREEYGDPIHAAIPELVFDLKTINYNLSWQMPDKNEWHSALGINGMKQFNRNKGNERLIPDYDLFDFGVFFFTQRTFNKINFSGGLRFDNRRLEGIEYREGSVIRFPAFHRTFSNLTASAGVSVEVNDHLNLKFNLARGFRAPSLPELSSNGAHEGSNRYEYGNSDLGSETSLQADAGIDYGFQHLNISVTAFVNSINDFIYSTKLQGSNGLDSMITVGGENLQAFKFKQQNAVLHGAEVSIDFHPHPLDWLHFENTFAFVNGSFSESVAGVKFLPFITAPKFTSELKADVKKWGNSVRQLYFKIGIEKNFSQTRAFTAFGTESPTAAYTLLNVGLGGEVHNNDNVIFSLHLHINNITDEAYQHHLSRLKYADVNMQTGRAGVNNTGRNFSLKMVVPFTLR